MGLIVLGAIVAVLSRTEVVLCDTAPPKAVLSVALPGPGVAIFAAPDRRLLVPLQGEDATLAINPSGPSGRTTGRLFPLFFDEVDRLHTVMADAVVTLSYPERVPLFRTPLPSGFAPWRAATSHDGRLVVVLSAERRSLAVVVTKGEVPPVRVGLPGAASAVVVGPNADWVLVGLEDGEVLLVDAAGSVAATRLGLGAAPVALAVGASGRDAVAVTRGPGGSAIVSIRVKPGSGSPLRMLARAPLEGAARAVVGADSEVVALTDVGLSVFSGPHLSPRGRLAIADATELAAVPAQASSVVPRWNDGTGPEPTAGPPA